MKPFVKILLSLACTLHLFAEEKKPNILLIFTDDLGYGDLGCYGGKKVLTPEIDRLASEGMRLTDFIIPANVCGPSRAALLTGRYPMRCGHPVARSSVIPKYDNYGIAPEEITIPELLKTAGYRSLLVGKWHLGFEVEGSHPLDAGFDEHFGIGSNYATTIPETHRLYRGKTIVKENAKFLEITKAYTDEVVKFIGQKREEPFFIMMSHHIPHTPILPSQEFKGHTKKGIYGDFIYELDHSTGRIMKALKENGLDENTLVVFTSDNGPAKNGSSGALSGGKYVTMEGGHRVPAIFRWPNKISKGTVSKTTATSMDLLPLFCDLAGIEAPSDRKIDGKNIVKILREQSKESPHDFLYYYNGINLQAVRQGDWKLHLPRSIQDQPFWAKKAGGNKKKIHLNVTVPMLFNLSSDVAEKKNVADQNPEILASLLKEADRVRKELGDLNVTGNDQRIPRLQNIQEKY